MRGFCFKIAIWPSKPISIFKFIFGKVCKFIWDSDFINRPHSSALFHVQRKSDTYHAEKSPQSKRQQCLSHKTPHKKMKSVLQISMILQYLWLQFQVAYEVMIESRRVADNFGIKFGL